MKTKFAVFIGCLLLLSPPNYAQVSNDVFRIYQFDGMETTIPLDAIRNIVFTSDGQMRISIEGENRDFAVLSVRNMVVAVRTGDAEIETPAGQKLLLYPNPVNDILNVQLLNSGATPALIQVFDLRGMLLLSRLCSADELSTGMVLHVDFLPGGMYLCRVQAGQLTLSTKFIK
ncbi:MAG: T9SS type A sorting domain-containing protein [Ignavibacteria bacterium]|nr:T9SS type A sorting domain-containing protein [Ignavibacteria bacterium]